MLPSLSTSYPLSLIIILILWPRSKRIDALTSYISHPLVIFFINIFYVNKKYLRSKHSDAKILLEVGMLFKSPWILDKVKKTCKRLYTLLVYPLVIFFINIFYVNKKYLERFKNIKGLLK